MENQPLQQQNILISGIETLEWGLKVKSEKGLIFNISKTKKNGEPTMAYEYISALPDNGMGFKKCFKYAEVPNKQGGTSRYVRIITDEQREESPSQNPSSVIPPQKQTTEETPDWNEINRGKVRCNICQGMLQAGKTPKEVLEDKINIAVLTDFIMGSKKAEVPNMAEEKANEDVPKSDDEINVEEIPF